MGVSHPGGEGAPDPEEEERPRRAAIAGARIARHLADTRVGMAPPIFGRKPEVKPKPVMARPRRHRRDYRRPG